MTLTKWLRHHVVQLFVFILLLTINPHSMSAGSIKYTREEVSRLQKARAVYLASVEKWNNASSYYEESPVITDLPLKAGKLNNDKIQAAIGYLNSARIGAGLRPLKEAPELTIAAQNKAVMVSYANEKGLPSGHHMDKYEGITDEMYNSGMKYMNENLFMCGFGGDIIDSINYALDDGFGDVWDAGHRHNLLCPYFTHIGLGQANSQGCHKFYCDEIYEVPDMVSWPSNGVTGIETLRDSGMNWTIVFYKDYHVTDKTAISVERINDGKKWLFNLKKYPSSTMGGTSRYRINKSNNLIDFYDSNFTLNAGDVYSITISNLANTKNENVSYSYRSVIEHYYLVELKSLQLSDSFLEILEGESSRLVVSPVPEEADLPEIKWLTSDNKIATVDKYGNVTGIKAGNVVITARTVDGKMSAKCNVKITPKKNTNAEKNESISVSEIHLSKNEFIYNGKVQKPKVTVKNGKKIVPASLYTLKWPAGCKNPGEYIVSVQTNDNYKTSLFTYYTIRPKGTEIRKLKAGKKRMTVIWKRQAFQITGYQIQYCLKKDFSNAKTITVKSSKKNSKIIKKLKRKKKYYVRMRTYKVSRGTKYYSAWSKTKSVKVR